MECLLHIIYLTKDDKGWGKNPAISQMWNITVKNWHREEVSQLTNEYRPSPRRLSVRSFYLQLQVENNQTIDYFEYYFDIEPQITVASRVSMALSQELTWDGILREWAQTK